MRFLLTTLFLQFVLLVAGQSPAGEWHGVLVHTSCLGSRYQYSVEMNIFPTGGNSWGGTIRYYSGTVDLKEQDKFPIWDFVFSANIKGDQVNINYSTQDEVAGRRRNFGYYIMGGYRIMLKYTLQGGTERLSGYYGGSNGGRGQIFFNRPYALENKVQSNSETFQKLRDKIAAKKGRPVTGAISTIDTLLPMPDTSQLSAQFVSAPQADSLARLSLTFKNQRKPDTSLVVPLPKAEYADLLIYDNAEEDGDTISVFADNELLAHRIRIGIKPITLRIPRPEKDTATLITMVAENLGSIPPNTAYMIVEAPDKKRYTINLSSNFSRSGTILLKWNE